MAGEIKRLIDHVINQKANGDPFLMKTTRLKLILKGINVDHYSSQSEDDVETIAQLKNAAKELNIQV